MNIVHKAAVSDVDGLEYVLSDATVDSYGDTVEPSGWDLSRFATNPIALFNHNSSAPIGKWVNVRVEGGKLKGRIEFAKAGTSSRIDEIRSLAEQGILRATSVGFSPIAFEPRKGGGQRYTKQLLHEVSIVSIPANPSAVQLARSMHVSDDTLSLVFAEHGEMDDGIKRRGIPGEHAANPTHIRNKTMRLGERIQAAESALLDDKDTLTELVGKDAPDTVKVQEMTARVKEREISLNALRDAESALAVKSATNPATTVPAEARRPLSMPIKSVKPVDYALRAISASLFAHVTKAPMDVALERMYGNDEQTRIVAGSVTKAASAVATTTTTGWAAELVQTVYQDFMEMLMPASVYPELSSRGLRLSFGEGGIVSIPTRSATPTLAGSFVGEGSPIPVRQGAFTAQTLGPKKMAVISTFTREIAEMSAPAIELLVRNAIQEDTSVAIDTVLLDATAASSIRPAGLRSGVTVTTATAGGGVAALIGDVTALTTALMTSSNNNLRAPVWIMNPIQAMKIGLQRDGTGGFLFKDDIAANRFMGFPVVQSSTVAAGMLLLVDAADFASVTGDNPRFDVSDQATIHMEDTTPLAIGTAGTPTVVAAPVRSMFQTDSIALRMILPMNWTMRRAGVLAWTQATTW